MDHIVALEKEQVAHIDIAIRNVREEREREAVELLRQVSDGSHCVLIPNRDDWFRRRDDLIDSLGQDGLAREVTKENKTL